ncbi:MAG: hypothetical protein E4H36_14790 [Spirochaetales bacterium]|nr:MAG: hypothetical protein E4H36_14790 [Spirochaetales bacterium]
MNYMLIPSYAFDSVQERILEARETRTLGRIKKSPCEQETSAAAAMKTAGKGKSAGSPLLAAMYW